jgi:hypothetical protein
MGRKQGPVIAVASSCLVIFPLHKIRVDDSSTSRPIWLSYLKTFHLPGTEGWDYLTMDSDARIL